LSVGGDVMIQAASETDELAAVVSEGVGTRQLSEQMEEFDGFERAITARRRSSTRSRPPSSRTPRPGCRRQLRETLLDD
jgi:hypothetical protein